MTQIEFSRQNRTAAKSECYHIYTSELVRSGILSFQYLLGGLDVQPET